MSLDEYPEPKGAYYTPAIQAKFDDTEAAEAAIAALRDAGFTTRDIHVLQEEGSIIVVVSEPTPGMLEEGRKILSAAGVDVASYGATSFE